MTEEELILQQERLGQEFAEATRDLNRQLNDFAEDNANSAFNNNIFFSGLPVRRQNQFRDDSFLPARSDLQASFDENSDKIAQARQSLAEATLSQANLSSPGGSSSSSNPGSFASAGGAGNGYVHTYKYNNDGSYYDSNGFLYNGPAGSTGVGSTSPAIAAVPANSQSTSSGINAVSVADINNSVAGSNVSPAVSDVNFREDVTILNRQLDAINGDSPNMTNEGSLFYTDTLLPALINAYPEYTPAQIANGVVDVGQGSF